MASGPRPFRIVADTNVLVSAFAFGRNSPPLQILDMARQGRLQAVVSPFIVEELERVLTSKLGWDADRLAKLRVKLRATLLLARPRARVDAAGVPEPDRRILECAVAARADALVTGDRRHLRPLGSIQGIPILLPAEFLQRHGNLPALTGPRRSPPGRSRSSG